MATERVNHPTVMDLQHTVYSFAQETFGQGREDAAWKKLFEELGEVLKDPTSPGEWGDVFILLLDMATIYQVDVGQATLDKLEVIRQRVWARTATGTFQHVPGAERTPTDAVSWRAQCQGGPLAGRTVERPGERPEKWVPSLEEAPPAQIAGHYEYIRTDRGMDKRDVHVYGWVFGGEAF